jgi:regulator of RNase E activity RraA
VLDVKKSKLSPKSLLKQLSYKKHNKIKKTVQIGNTEICKDEFKIENLDFEDPKTLKKLSKSQKVKKEIGFKSLKNLLDQTSSCQISDAMAKISKKNGVLEGITSINGKRAYGRIVTVKTSSDDWGTSLLGIQKAKKGNILFIETSGESSAIWGELTSSSSFKKKLAGTVIWGATRDIDYINKSDYPVFAKETVPNAGDALGLGEVNINLKVGKNKEYLIKPGDFLFGDESGVVHIPQELFCDVMLKTLEIKMNEKRIISEIKKGIPLYKIVGLDNKE